MTAMFRHKKSEGLYTVVAQAVSLVAELKDMNPVNVYQGDHGFVASVLNPGMNRRSNIYVATVQAIEPFADGTLCVLYRGTDGSHWLRPKQEFTDGRFDPMNAQAACMMPANWHLGGGA